MKRTILVVTVALAAAVLLTACFQAESGVVNTPAEPSASELSGATPLPSAVVLVTTQTYTPEPEPTATPLPALPSTLNLLTYRTFDKLEELATLPYHHIIDLDFSPDHRYLRLRQALTEDTHNDIFLDLETWEQAFSLQGGQRIYFSPESVSVAALDGKSLTVYDIKTGEIKLQYNSRNEIAALSPDGRTLVEIEAVEEGSGTTFRIFDLTTEQEKFRFFINGELEKDSLQFDDDGKLLAGISFLPPNTYISTIWNLDKGRVIYSIYGYSEIALHPFGSEIAISNAKQSYISLVSTVSWLQKTYLGPAVDGPAYYSLAYSSGGRLIYALSDRDGEVTTANFWYPPSGEQLPFAHDLDLLAVTISPDNRLLAASQKEGPVIIWGVPE
jgi:WD40 repeat protein